MKEVREVRVPLDALAGRLGVEASPAYFEFLLRRIKTPVVRIEGNELVHESFIPVELMLKQTHEEIAAGGARPTPCLRCERVFDADREDGIFADPAQLEGYICRPCAEGMTAWTYFQDVLKA